MYGKEKKVISELSLSTNRCRVRKKGTLEHEAVEKLTKAVSWYGGTKFSHDILARGKRWMYVDYEV